MPKSNDICLCCERPYNTHLLVTGQCSNINNNQWLQTTFKKKGPDKIKCYVFDFGDMPLITEDIKIVMDWLEADVTGMKKEGESYESKITIKYMTRKQIESLPEWS
jgi:uncharacterized protein YaiI (UPF0178 family)